MPDIAKFLGVAYSYRCWTTPQPNRTFYPRRPRDNEKHKDGTGGNIAIAPQPKG